MSLARTRIALRLLAVAALAATTAGCFQPMYAEHTDGSPALRDKLLTVAYQNPDGKIAVVVMNKTDDKIDYFLWIKGQATKVTSNPHSIETLVVE